MQHRTLFGKRILIAIMVALMGIGIVAAQADDTTAQDDSTEETFEERRGNGRFGERGNRGGRGFGGSEILEATGLTREELREALQNGATLAEILTANGVDVEAFITEQLANIEDRLDEAVAEGRITAEEAAERLESAEERIRERLNGTFERPNKNNNDDDTDNTAANV